jgi:hypothetical protein
MMGRGAQNLNKEPQISIARRKGLRMVIVLFPSGENDESDDSDSHHSDHRRLGESFRLVGGKGKGQEEESSRGGEENEADGVDDDWREPERRSMSACKGGGKRGKDNRPAVS